MDYFERIGLERPREPTFAALSAIVGNHVRAIPFENLDVLLGRPPRLDLESLRQKLVASRRGGYCYEHATLCAAELEAIGFAVRRHSARVVMVTPRDKAPRTHMFLTAMNHVLDPGFGGLAPHAPVPLDGTPVGHHRVVREGTELALYHGDQRLWVSSLEADLPVDFEMANHFTATWPQSPFVQRLMLRAFTPEGRITAMNRDVTIVRGGETSTRQLADRAELQRLLYDVFAIDCDISQLRVPTIPEWG
ncbi:MAG: arylamine N-acetyltransferase [Deltaproteobacteria bacterium]|nr:arylamine N-acetyltransferase [Deltaproteobacteria bacterium]